MKTTTEKPDTRWLRDCGWTGWLEDTITGKIVTWNGDEFSDSTSLRRWLESLPAWPPICSEYPGGRDVPPNSY